jgi:uncharacterized coiled-coil protein SlyX
VNGPPPGRLSSAGPLHPGGIARPAPASAEHEPVAATDEHELAKTKVHGSSPKDQYDGNLRLFLGNDLADQGEGISLIRDQVEANLCFRGALLSGVGRELHDVQVASIIRGLQERAAETEARARALAESALERLRQAETRINDAETARARAEDTTARLGARLQEAERELERTQARTVAVQNKLADAEHQVRSAEARAAQAEKAVTQINDAIRAQLLGLQNRQQPLFASAYGASIESKELNAFSETSE